MRSLIPFVKTHNFDDSENALKIAEKFNCALKATVIQLWFVEDQQFLRLINLRETKCCNSNDRRFTSLWFSVLILLWHDDESLSQRCRTNHLCIFDTQVGHSGSISNSWLLCENFYTHCSTWYSLKDIWFFTRYQLRSMEEPAAFHKGISRVSSN